MARLLVIFLLVCTTATAQTGTVYHLDTNRQVHNLKAYSFVLVDSLRRFSEKEIISGRYDSLFIPYRSVENLNNQGRPYWIRFTVQSSSAIHNWILFPETGTGDYPYKDEIELFVTVHDSLFAKDITGVLVPRSQKIIQRAAGFYGVSFSLPAQQTAKVYVKSSSAFINTNPFSFPVVQSPSIPVAQRKQATFAPLLNVLTLVFSILSFFFYFFIREKAYLFFALFTLLLSQHYLILDTDVPFIDRYIPEHPLLIMGFWRFLSMGSFVCFCLFGKAFMNLPSLSPKLNRWFTIYIVIDAGFVIVNSAWSFLFKREVFPESISMLLVAIAFLFFIRFAFFKSVLPRIYIGGGLWLFSFTILGFFWNRGLINLPFNPWPVGQMGVLLIYVIALAYKVRLNERERAVAARIRDMDEMKSRFFANISHEFRTPLTLIHAPLQQIEETLNNNKEGVATVPLRHIKTMRRNTDRLLELVNQLLDLSKLDSGKMKLQVVKGDVLQLLRAITASFESVAERKAINYHVHFPERSYIGFFDKDKLEKIFSNLLSNAFKYTPEGGTVSVHADVEEQRLRFSIEDSGPGIPKKEVDKIFDRFYQLEGTEDKGSGIGLALVKELTNLYRGQISVSSEPGKGSRFRVTVPVEKSLFKEEELVYGTWESQNSFINTSLEESETYISNSFVHPALPLLLLVEDNHDLRQFIREVVQEQYQVVEAVNGKEGFEKAISEIPDIVVSDVMMPLMNGFDLTEKLKKDERTSHIPVILLTAKAGQVHKLEGLTTGADDYLTKPFDRPELLLRMQNLITQRKLLRKKFAGAILLKPSEVAVNSTEENFLQKLMQAIETNMGEEDFGVEQLAKEMALSRSQLHRKLVALSGQSPSEVLRNTRLLRAKELLQKKSATPSEVAFKVGFNSHAYFSKCFKEEFGISPSEVV
jgi:signal transduction histidine kinase/DNA-binding response OmpR family regulator